MQLPSFAKGKRQLAAEEVEKTRKIASVQIHIERVICLKGNEALKKKFFFIFSKARKYGEEIKIKIKN